MTNIRDRVFALFLVPTYPFYLIFNRFCRRHSFYMTDLSYMDWVRRATPTRCFIGLVFSLAYWQAMPVIVRMLIQ